MNCKNLKIKQKKYKKYLYCNILKKEINYSDCKNCQYKEYKERKPIKKRTYKLAKREKERFSIIYTDLSKCCVCPSKSAVHKNEVFEGAYRQTSIKYGMVCPLCETHHRMFHDNSDFNIYFKVMFQKEFLKNNTMEEFISLFGQNYIYKQQKKDCNETK